jgi:hypothetical protein
MKKYQPKKDKATVVNVKIDVAVPFFSYGTSKKDQKAKQQVIAQIKSALHTAYCFGLNVEPGGEFDTTGNIRVKITRSSLSQ